MDHKDFRKEALEGISQMNFNKIYSSMNKSGVSKSMRRNSFVIRPGEKFWVVTDMTSDDSVLEDILFETDVSSLSRTVGIGSGATIYSDYDEAKTEADVRISNGW